jgi:hypothetical protein
MEEDLHGPVSPDEGLACCTSCWGSITMGLKLYMQGLKLALKGLKLYMQELAGCSTIQKQFRLAAYSNLDVYKTHKLHGKCPLQACTCTMG